MRRYPGAGAFALFFHPHPREFATQDKKSANARGLARGGGDERSWNWLMHNFGTKLSVCLIKGVGLIEGPLNKGFTVYQFFF